MKVYGDLKRIYNIPFKSCEFEVLNELKDLSNRSDSNCLYHTRFVFECDDVAKDEQIKRAMELAESGIIVRATDSGNKSIHCIVEFDKDCENICFKHYKAIWHSINDIYFNGHADNACANPARLTRRPNAIRKNGKLQKLIYDNKNNIISANNSLFKSIWRVARAKIAGETIILTQTTNKGSNSASNHDNQCINYDVVRHFLDTSYPKMSGNGDSSISLFKAIRCCLKYSDNETLKKVLDKARRERWSENELNRIITNIKSKYL